MSRAAKVGELEFDWPIQLLVALHILQLNCLDLVVVQMELMEAVREIWEKMDKSQNNQNSKCLVLCTNEWKSELACFNLTSVSMYIHPFRKTNMNQRISKRVLLINHINRINIWLRYSPLGTPVSLASEMRRKLSLRPLKAPGSKPLFWMGFPPISARKILKDVQKLVRESTTKPTVST